MAVPTEGDAAAPDPERVPGRAAALAMLDTAPKLLLHHEKERPDAPSWREKDYGIWQSFSFAEVAEQVRAMAHGLAAAGFQRGDRLAIVGDNRPRLYWSMIAAQALGGVAVPLYQDSVAEELAYVIGHAGARFVFAEDQEQVDKVLGLRQDLPELSRVFYDDPRGLLDYDEPILSSYEALCERGREHAASAAGFLEAEIEKGKGEDTSVLLYTSGTTGRPKGVMLSFDNILVTAQNAAELDGLGRDEEVLAYLPMAWVGDHIFSYGQSLTTGFCVSCPESGDTVLTDLRELGPTYFFAPPRIFEGLLTTVTVRMQDASPIKQRLYAHFMGVARKLGVKRLAGERLRLFERLHYGLGELLIYGPLKNVLGLSRVRLAYTAGEAIGPDLFTFYRAIGINLKQLYGQTEGSVFVTIQPDGEVFADTVGKPAPGVELEVDDSGEVRYRGPGVFQRYYKQPEETSETLSEDGWVRTGDAGFFDERGHLRIIDRAKDVGRFADGELFAPKYIENKLKFFPNIAEAVAFGDGRDSCRVLISMDLEALGSWAERNAVAFASFQELSQNPRVYGIIARHIEEVNRDLSQEPKLSHSQITRFAMLPKALDADDGELTRTRKLRRNVIAERYAPLIEALYSEAGSCHIATELTFEDGRKGQLEADVHIADCKSFEHRQPEENARAGTA
ncbi:MAG: AMP-binding protein [Myxococcales bacterium]|nr:AMP-binding protein [Myxococcales bacterium]